MKENKYPLINKLLFFFIILNLLVIDIWEGIKIKNNDWNIVPKPAEAPNFVQITPTPNLSCPISCIATIKEATASARLISPTITPLQIRSQQDTIEVKEYFIPIGTGTNSTDDWEDVPGVRVNIDSNRYWKIKSVVFEATVRVPTLDQWVKVRLYNVTDKQPVSSSEVSFTIGSQPTLLISPPFTIDTGIKTYQVQMKTQIRHPAYLDQSRIHITTY